MQIKIIQIFIKLVKSGWIIGVDELKFLLLKTDCYKRDVDKDPQLKNFLLEFISQMGLPLYEKDLSPYLSERK